MAKKAKGSRVTPKGTRPHNYVEKVRHVHDESCAHGGDDHDHAQEHEHGHGHDQHGHDHAAGARADDHRGDAGSRRTP